MEQGDFLKNRIIILLGTLGVWVCSYLYAPYVHSGPTLCLSSGILGMPCPACGLTRAFCALTHGKFHEAFGWNALCVPLGILFLAAPLVSLFEIATRRPSRFYNPLFSMRVAYAFGFTVGIYHIGRVLFWFHAGTLAREFFHPSLAYKIYAAFFPLG